MEGIDSKRMMGSLMVLMMIVLAQGQAELAVVPPGQAELAVVPQAPPSRNCAKKCFFSCILRLIPQRIALCFGLCMIGCKLHPSQVVYNCTQDCANSTVIAYNPTAEKAVVVVGSCYKNCKKKIHN